MSSLRSLRPDHDLCSDDERGGARETYWLMACCVFGTKEEMSIPDRAAWSLTIRLISQLRDLSSLSLSDSRYSSTPGSKVTPAGLTVRPVVFLRPRGMVGPRFDMGDTDGPSNCSDT